MPKTSKKMTKYVSDNIKNALDSIDYPLYNRNRYWITLEFDIPAKIEDAFIIFKLFRRSLSKKFKRIGGIFNIEFKIINRTPHFHLILMDYGADEDNPVPSTELFNMDESELGKFVYEKWGGLVKEKLNESLTKVSIKIKPFSVDRNGKIDGDLRDYVAKLYTKAVPPQVSIQKGFCWWGWVSEKAVKRLDDGPASDGLDDGPPPSDGNEVFYEPIDMTDDEIDAEFEAYEAYISAKVAGGYPGDNLDPISPATVPLEVEG